LLLWLAASLLLFWLLGGWTDNPALKAFRSGENDSSLISSRF
jgi:hypothetical protein